MLKHLQIRNFAIVPSLELDIHEGFTAITGETGAGKSILVDALGLLLGDRSDATWVRAGAERAELTAEFSVDHNKDARDWLENADLYEDGDCLLRRTINSKGRSRAFINGSPVTVAQMQALGSLLVEIHGQNEHMRLTKSAEQFKLLDGSGSYAAAIKQLGSAHAEWRRVSAELDALDRDSTVSASDLEFLEFQLSELQQHNLSADSIIALQNEHDRLAAGGALLEALTAGMEILEPETVSGNGGVNAGLHTALGHLHQFIPLDNDIGAACQMLEEAAVNCGEALDSLRSARERVDLDPSRLENAAESLSRLHELSRKHRVPMDGLEAVMVALAGRIERAGSSEKRRIELENELQGRLADYRKAAKKLHQQRKKHAAELSSRVTALMADLGMAGGTFELAVELDLQAPPSARGDDSLAISISANPGLPPGPLNKIASGGELSRISLAIKVATAGGGDAVTQIFDEVDAGIGGDTANAVGRLIQRLSQRAGAGIGQALCVTHLAQVAVCAKHQLQVRKETGKETTVVDTNMLGIDERVDEIARMLSGTISDQSRAHAGELLAQANKSD